MAARACSWQAIEGRRRQASGKITDGARASAILMSAQLLTYYDLVSNLPADTVVTFHDVSWNEYEELLDQVGEASGLRISYDEGELQVMTLSSEHEKYASFINRLVSQVSFRLRINISFFGSATMRRAEKRKGGEPDTCFYVQTAAALGNRIELDFAKDPPPDVVVEVDLHHDSRSKFPIYAALEVPEIWRYNGEELSIHLLEKAGYVAAAESRALPLLSGAILTQFLARLRQEGELQTILAFDEWLQARTKQ